MVERCAVNARAVGSNPSSPAHGKVKMMDTQSVNKRLISAKSKNKKSTVN